jgi:hypothetical protein
MNEPASFGDEGRWAVGNMRRKRPLPNHPSRGFRDERDDGISGRAGGISAICYWLMTRAQNIGARRSRSSSDGYSSDYSYGSNGSSGSGWSIANWFSSDNSGSNCSSDNSSSSNDSCSSGGGDSGGGGDGGGGGGD